MVKSSLAPKMEISGKRKFGAVSNLMTLDVLCNQFIKGLAGITAAPSLMPLRSFTKNSNSQHTYFIHISFSYSDTKIFAIAVFIIGERKSSEYH
jgi:hypothetical protein